MRSRRSLTTAVGAVALTAILVAPTAAHDPGPANAYAVTYLVSDGSVPAASKDANLVNGWGLTRGPTTPWWVSDNGTDKSTLYNGAGATLGLVVDVAGGPTGTVFNPGTGFAVGGAPARFLFATEGGQILGWQSGLGTVAGLGADRTKHGSVYKGLTFATAFGEDFIYATDFHNGRVDVFDSSWTLQRWTLRDRRLPRGYAPFGIQALNGVIFVTYAKQDKARHDEVDGVGRGFVDAFSPNGTLLGRVASRGPLNAPWGLAWAPADFGRFSGDLIVGNFGDGKLDAYRWHNGHWHLDGRLRGTDHRAISIDGLWGIAFGGGNASSGPTQSLYFAAGPNGEKGGSFGTITVAP
jgi:uncharacterized protein (TIGR03118 family)